MPMCTSTSALAIVGPWPAITNAKSNIPKINFFTLLPPYTRIRIKNLDIAIFSLSRLLSARFAFLDPDSVSSSALTFFSSRSICLEDIFYEIHSRRV